MPRFAAPEAADWGDAIEAADRNQKAAQRGEIRFEGV